MTWRIRRRRRASTDGPPDPAAMLDRFEAAIERRLPAEPRPLWAGVLVFVLRLVLGRGSWVVGALLTALAAPWFVFPYRQVDSMARAAWHRQTATATAAARVERVELRLLPWPIDGGQRVVPQLHLALDAAATGGDAALVRYLPRGEGLEDHHQWFASASLLHQPPAVSPGFRLLWRSATADGPGFDLTWRVEDDAALHTASSWNSLTHLENALVDLDRPIDLLIGDWTRPGAVGRELPVRFHPGDPGRLFVADALDHLPPTGGSGFGELILSLILMVPFGLPFWWFGTRLLGRGLPPNHRHLMVWVPLALLPLWGGRYLEVIERLSPGALENNALLAKVGSTQLLPGSSRIHEGDDWTTTKRRRIDLEHSRFAPVLAGVDLSRPPRPLAGGAAWRELSTRFQTALLALDDEALERMLLEAARIEPWQGTPALLPLLTETARRTTLDPARGAGARDAARNVIRFVLQAAALDLCHPAHGAHREDLERLRDHPDGELAGLAGARLAELDGFIAARRRDWGEVCP